MSGGGTLVEFIGKVHRLGNTSISIRVDVFLEQVSNESREQVVSGVFTLVALDTAGKPTAVAPER